MPLTKRENLASKNSPSALKALFLASRPKTWVASISPVFIGGSLAPHLNVPIFILTLLFSLCIQIGTNFANDYFDFIKGADTHLRNGPKRATLEGWVSPKTMLQASLFSFGWALFIAIPLMLIAGLWSFFLAAACVIFGILYTGGPKPLGYLGFGELLVFSFFGPIATCGTYFLQTGHFNFPIFVASLSPGFLSCAILIANNLRDEKSDRAANKMTLIARFGKNFGKIEYALALLLPAFIPPLLVYAFDAPISLLSTSIIAVVSIAPIKKVFSYRDPLELISVLQQSAFILFLYTTLFSFFVW